MTMADLTPLATVFSSLLAIEDGNWWVAAICGLAIVLQLAALGVV